MTPVVSNEAQVRLFTTDISFEFIRRQLKYYVKHDDGIFQSVDPLNLLDLVLRSKASFLELDDELGKFIYSLFATPKGHAILSLK